MSKTTFLGYVPSLKSKHEATIVGGKAIESKGGSIRYTLQGEYDGRKTLPKTVSKADFESVYGFDAKEAESVIVGNPSPASVEPPAPSETPFPQEPSNENFSADVEMVQCEDPSCDEMISIDEGLSYGGFSYCEYCYDQVMMDERQNDVEDDICFVCSNPDTEYEVTYCESDADCGKAICDDCRYEEMFEKGQGGKWVKLDEDPEDDDSAMADVCRECADNNEPVLFEAFGLFEDKEEEEEKPKTQEFTVVLQEGDRLELTDIEEDIPEEMEPKEEDNTEDEENDEKEAEEGTRTFVVSSVDYETDDEDQDELDLPQDFTITLDGSDMKHLEQMEKEYNEEYPGEWPDYEMQEIADLMVDTISDESGWLVEGFYFEELMPDGTLKSFNAVQAKITRPVKEEEDEEKEEEGMSTLMKVGLGVGALAVGAAILGAEGEYSCPHCSTDLEVDGLDMSEKFTCPDCDGLIYESLNSGGHHPGDFMAEDEGESDYWAGENAHWRAEGEDFQKMTSNEPTNSNFSAENNDNKEYHICTYLQEQIDEDGWEGTYLDGTGIEKDIEWDVGEITQTYDEAVDYIKKENEENPLAYAAIWEWDKDALVHTFKDGTKDYGEYTDNYEIIIWTDPEVNFSADSWKVRGEKRLKEEFARNPRCGECGGGTTEETESGVQGTFVYQCQNQDCLWNSWPPHKDAENFSAEEMERFEASRHHGGDKKKKLMKDNYENKWKKNLNDRFNKKTIADEDLRDFKRHGMADTVGSPSPSGPPSVPEPAEATGSEPSNENFSADEMFPCHLCDTEFDEDNWGGFIDAPHNTLVACKTCYKKTNEAESKNLKMALGITALGIGLAAILGKDKLTKLFERFGL
ncbi:MAG: hypothetical protein GY751_21485 [Bacteroidetes bacterium]|nr:hypothetical protein [Bacteroidota bacterium]